MNPQNPEGLVPQMADGLVTQMTGPAAFYPIQWESQEQQEPQTNETFSRRPEFDDSVSPPSKRPRPAQMSLTQAMVYVLERIHPQGMRPREILDVIRREGLCATRSSLESFHVVISLYIKRMGYENVPFIKSWNHKYYYKKEGWDIARLELAGEQIAPPDGHRSRSKKPKTPAVPMVPQYLPDFSFSAPISQPSTTQEPQQDLPSLQQPQFGPSLPHVSELPFPLPDPLPAPLSLYGLLIIRQILFNGLQQNFQQQPVYVPGAAYPNANYGLFVPQAEQQQEGEDGDEDEDLPPDFFAENAT